MATTTSPLTPEAQTLMEWLRQPISDADIQSEWDACRRSNPTEFRFGLPETLAELRRAKRIERSPDNKRWKWAATTDMAPREAVQRTLF